MSVGKRLKNIRKTHNLSIDELIERLNQNYNLNISKSMVSRWENDKSEPLNKYLAAYAKEFSVDMNYLVGVTFEEIEDPIVVAAHSDRKLTPEEQQDVIDYIKYLKSKDKK